MRTYCCVTIHEQKNGSLHGEHLVLKLTHGFPPGNYGGFPEKGEERMVDQKAEVCPSSLQE